MSPFGIFIDENCAKPPIHRKLGASAPEPVPKDIPLNERLHNCARLANLGWDHTTESFHLPALTENDEWIYHSLDWANINEAMAV